MFNNFVPGEKIVPSVTVINGQALKKKVSLPDYWQSLMQTALATIAFIQDIYSLRFTDGLGIIDNRGKTENRANAFLSNVLIPFLNNFILYHYSASLRYSVIIAESEAKPVYTSLLNRYVTVFKYSLSLFFWYRRSSKDNKITIDEINELIKDILSPFIFDITGFLNVSAKLEPGE